MADKPTNVESILCSAVEIASPAQRARYLDEACGDDGDLRAEVERLLRAHGRAGSFLGQPAAGDRPSDVLNAPTESGGLPDAVTPPPNAVSLDFLQPCDVPGRLGKLGTYEVNGVIGRGGMGVVLEAQDPKLNRVVAVKVLSPEFAANPTARKRFLREARAAAAVSHPHVVAIHSVGESGNTPYLVMECIHGQTLQTKIEREGTLKLTEILRIGSQIAGGLAAAHAQGLVHRDVKPSNILLENSVERVKITDFGLARAVDDIGMTRTGDVAGTPEFMSPEQAQGLAVEHRSDLFSLGSVLYAMCTGRSPFRADTTVAVLRRVCDDVPRPIGEVNPDVPEDLVAIIDRLLAKNPDDRFQTAEEVAELLGGYLAYLQHPTNSPPLGSMSAPVDLSAKAGAGDATSVSRRGPSGRRLWAVAGLVLLALFAVLCISEAAGVTEFAATMIRVVTGEGTLVVTVDDPAINVTVEGQNTVIAVAGRQEVRLKPGKYRLSANKNGKPVPSDQQSVTIARGGREVVDVTFVPLAAKSETAEAESSRPSGPTSWTDILPAGAPAPAVAPFDEVTAKGHQQAWADYLGMPVERQIDLPGGEKLTLVLIPPGEFDMGSTKEEVAMLLSEAKARSAANQYIDRVPSEAPKHRVRITKPFWLGRHEVTRGQFRQFVDDRQYQTEAERDGTGGWGWIDNKWVQDPRFVWNAAEIPLVASKPEGKTVVKQTENHPVANVTWNDAAAFCEWLSEKKGLTCHLPTEAQWEYACRAGTPTTWHCGESETVLKEYAWFSENAGRQTHPVGQLRANAWGLHDMHGNVWEWCQDWLSEVYYGASPLDDPLGPPRGMFRVYRGGSWRLIGAFNCRAAFRYWSRPSYRDIDRGFRLAAVLADAPGKLDAAR